jgi:hypothetical protein
MLESGSLSPDLDSVFIGSPSGFSRFGQKSD